MGAWGVVWKYQTRSPVFGRTAKIEFVNRLSPLLGLASAPRRNRMDRARCQDRRSDLDGKFT